jgi:hypothetical protein
MKKLAMTAVAAAAVLGAGAAHAYTSGTFSNGFVVPNVIHEASGATTAVGIINTTDANVPVYWTFHDQESNHVTDGCFVLTGKDYEPFVWSQKSGTGLAGKRGYLVFAVGNTSTCGTSDAAASLAASSLAIIAGNAFYVDPVAKDVAFTPVIDGPLTLTGNLTKLDADSLTAVGGAASVGGLQKISARYFIDGAPGGNDTSIVVWSTGNQKATYTVNIYDDKQNRKSVNFDLQHAELDWFNPEEIVGRPADFLDGFIEWDVPALGSGTSSVTTGSVFVYSVISSPAFGAVQTVLGAHTVK